MSTQPKPFLTPEEYLAIERQAETKSEYWDGQMFPMSGEQRPHDVSALSATMGVRRAHILITVNATAQFATQLASRPCETYSADMRVRISSGVYANPDVAVACGEPRFLDDTQDTLLNPSLIVEVQSPSTEAYDRGKKFELYRGIESLREYLMISSERVHAELYTRQPSGRWLLTDAARLEDELDLISCACRLKLADLYNKVEFTDPAAQFHRGQQV